MFRFGINIGELQRIIRLIDTVVNDRWARDVPVVPGDPKYVEDYKKGLHGQK